jgi:hypothetical protein
MHAYANLGKSNGIAGTVAAEDDHVLSISNDILDVLLLIAKGAVGLGIRRWNAEFCSNCLYNAVTITTNNKNSNALRS